ncbi:hypothetical protein GF420_04650 [candidate division GN15 bacterium]|nr:hypothetical protein [candidate division GN15 bacterium]
MVARILCQSPPKVKRHLRPRNPPAGIGPQPSNPAAYGPRPHLTFSAIRAYSWCPPKADRRVCVGDKTVDIKKCMNLSRYLTEELVKLEMDTRIAPPEEGASIEKWQQNAKEEVLKELVTFLAEGNRVGNESKLLIDFVNRERKASTAIGHGVAVPHIRSLQAKEFMMAFARSSLGYDFQAPDDEPVRLFFVMAAPPYDDNLYLKAFKSLAEILQYETFRRELLEAESPGEILRALRGME